MKLAVLGALQGETSLLASRLAGHDARQLSPPLRRIRAFNAPIPPPLAPSTNGSAENAWRNYLQHYLVSLEAFEASQSETTLIAVSETPLQMAVTCDVVMGDSSLYAQAVQHHSSYALHLLLGNDAGEITEPDQQVDIRLREVMNQHGIGYATVYGQGTRQSEQVLSAISSCIAPPDAGNRSSTWCWSCESCSDAGCEHQLFSALLGENRSSK